MPGDGGRSAGGRRVAILIAGPTASGKSALALRVAGAIGGVVINADSMQVYRDLRILSARPTEADEALVPHALYGTVDGATTHSVARWLADVERALREVADADRTPILVGGTGLYFKALTQGLSDIPPVPDAIRSIVRSWAATRPPVALHAELARRDPWTARRLRPTDPQRVTRALEVHLATGESLASYQANRATPLLGAGRYLGIRLMVDRAMLRERVDRRFEAMMREGAIEEVARLRESALDTSRPIMRAHGVPPILHHLRGESTLAVAIAQGQADTRRYLKRQDTFFLHQLPDFLALDVANAEDAILRRVAQS